jgi:hypothetical protein
MEHQRENPGVQYMFSTGIRSVEYRFSDSIRCVSIRFVSIRTVKNMHPILDAKCNKTKFSMQFH